MEDLDRNRSIVKVYNFILMVICAFAVACYFIFPFCKYHLSVNVSKAAEQGAALRQPKEERKYEQSSEFDINDVLEKLYGANITFTFDLEVSGLDVLSLIKPTEENVDKFFDKNIKPIIDGLNKDLGALFDAAVPAVVSSIGVWAIETQLPEGVDIDSYLQSQNIDKVKLETAFENIINILYEGTTLDNFDEQITAELHEVLKNSDLDESIATDVAPKIVGSFRSLADDEGNLKVDTASLMQLILSYAGADALEAKRFVNSLRKYEEGGATGDFDFSKILSMINDETSIKGVITGFGQYVAIALLVTIAIWVLGVLKLLFKMGSKNPCAGMGFQTFFGCLLFWVVHAIPGLLSLVINAINSGKVDSLEVNGVPVPTDSFKGIAEMQVVTSSGYTWLCGFAIVVIGILGYNHFKRKVKKGLRANRNRD